MSIRFRAAAYASGLGRRLRRWVTIRDRPSPSETAIASLASVSLVIAAWCLLTNGPVESRIVSPVTLPSFGDTLFSFHSLWFEREVSRAALASLGRVFGGFLLAAAIAVPLGVAAGSFLRLHAFLKPLSVFGRNVPVAALIPLTLMWFGLGETQKVMFIFLASVAFVLFDSASAVEGVPDNYLDAAYTLGARFVWRRGAAWGLLAGAIYCLAFTQTYRMLTPMPTDQADAALAQAWRHSLFLIGFTGFALGFVLWLPIAGFQAIGKVLFPLAMPDIVNSLRLLFGLAFGYIMLAETINAERGLGAIINLSQRQGPREHIYLVLILIALLAYGIDRGILTMQRYVFPYRAVEEN
jgi:NitT/TauT family transport system permease protein